jgi:hypothetical protein
MAPPARLLGMILPENLTRCNKIAYLEVKKLTKNMPGGQNLRPETKKVLWRFFPIRFLLRKVLPVAQAFRPVQTGWRAGTPAPLTFSCFTGGPKVHE